jgi:hypothetical protein
MFENIHMEAMVFWSIRESFFGNTDCIVETGNITARLRNEVRKLGRNRAKM